MVRVVETNKGKSPLHCNVVLLSPHSDDIAFSLGAFLLGQCDVSHIQIITVFSISASTADESIKDPAVVSAIRKAEDGCFVESLGRDVGSIWLDRKDAPLRLHISDEAVFSSDPSYIGLNEVRHVVDKVKEEYGSFNLLFAPMALGQHIDHVLVRNAALELLSDGFAVLLYEDLPYAADFSLSEIERYTSQLGALAGQEFELLILETGITVEEKVVLLSCYQTQMDPQTESRVRSHADRCNGNSVVERVWAPKNALPAIQRMFKCQRS